MSITNTDLIADALRAINVIDETEACTAEQFADGIKKLNQMMELWEEMGIRLEYFAQSVSSDTCPIPKYAEIGVTNALAILLAPTYGSSVTPELAATSQTAYAAILRKAVQEALQPATMVNRSPEDAVISGGWSILTGP